MLQLHTGGQTYVLRPDCPGVGPTTNGTPHIGVDAQGRIFLQNNRSARQLLLPSLLNATKAQALVQAAVPGSILVMQSAKSDGVFTVTVAGQPWHLVPQRVLGRASGGR